MSPWFGSVRVRAALAAALIVGAALALSALGVLSLLRGSLYTSATNTARAEALDITSFIVTRGRVPRRLPISADEMAEQIVVASGAVVASSANVRGQPAMAGLRPAPGLEASRSAVLLHLHFPRRSRVNLDLDYRFVVAAVGFKSGTLTGTVLVASSLGAADHALDLVALALATSLPVLALLVGGLVWVLTGWALRPVELIRAEVAGLSVSDLHRRVPEPPAKDEVGRLARTMNAMLERLAASTDRQSQLVADVSHELRNPLAALRAQLEVAVAHPGSGTPGLLKGSIVEVERMAQLVDDLLTLARIDEGMLPLRAGDVDLDDLALVHADRLRVRGRVEVSVRGVGAARLRGDEAQLRRVVANLADNAERHARKRVEFAVRREAGSVYLALIDDGPGVPPAMRERIFERFVRLDSARAHRDSGAGLGLAIVREITLAHGGDVWVEDAEPGARFVVRLPVTPVAPAGRGG